jgi:hypothetical protein
MFVSLRQSVDFSGGGGGGGVGRDEHIEGWVCIHSLSSLAGGLGGAAQPVYSGCFFTAVSLLHWGKKVATT